MNYEVDHLAQIRRKFDSDSNCSCDECPEGETLPEWKNRPNGKSFPEDLIAIFFLA